jgi:cytochrome c biogenesis protein CcmG/thiol:disulfide interchange protein DsbE
MVPNVPARLFGTTKQRRTIAGQIREIDAGHRFSRTAAMGARRTGVHKCAEEHDAANLQHYSLSAYVSTRSIEKHRSSAWHSKSNHNTDTLFSIRNGRGNTWRNVLARVAHAAAAVAVLWLASAPGAARAAPEIDQAAPVLIVKTLDGTIIDLATLRGKVVLINYWATWCAPCRREMPKLETFYRRYHAKGLEIIGISIDFERDLEKARKAAKSVTYPMAVAKSITDDGFGIPKGVPITWIIDTDGKVRDRFIDVRDELLDGIVVPLLPR